MISVPNQFRQRNYTKSYNKWHWERLNTTRNALGQGLLMMDLDSLEIRGNKIVALIETRTTHTPLNDWQRNIVLSVAQSLGVPAYLVSHNEEVTEFTVTDLESGELKAMKEFEYIEFLKNL